MFDNLHFKYGITSFEEQCEIIYSFLKKNYGGGGHAGAAGCKVTEEQFIEILKNRTF